MKRLSLLFSLLLLCVGVAVADYTPTAETPVVGEKYALKVVSWGSNTASANKYLRFTKGNNRIYLKELPTTNDINTLWNEYTITLASSSSVDGAYNIKINDLYFPSFKSGASGGFTPVSVAKAGTYDIVNKLVKVEGGYKIQNCFSTNNVYAETGYVTTNGTELQVTSNADNALIVTFEKIKTVNYTDNKNNSFSRNVLSDTETFDPSIDFYTNFNPSSITLDNDKQTYSVTCDQNYPFEEGKFYKMSIRGTENGAHNITWDGNSSIATRSNKTENQNGYWSFEHINNTQNQIKIYTNAKGYRQALTYSGSNDGTAVNVAEVGTDGTAFLMCKIDGGNLRLANIASDDININDYGGNMKFWANANSKTEAGCAINLYEATTNLPTSITTFKVTDENNITATLTAPTNFYWSDGMNANNINLGYATCNTATIANNSLNITYTNNYPFEVSTADNKKWCYLKVRNDDTHYQLVNGTATKSDNNTVNRSSLSSIRTYNENTSAQWAFVKVENELNRFKIYNRSDETKVLYLSARNNMTDLTLADENTTSGFTSFYINPQPKEFTTFTGGFTIKPDKDETHAIGDHNNGVLTYWSNRKNLTELNDEGSIFRVVNLTADCNNCIAASPEVTNIGTYSQTSRTTLATTTSVTDFFAKYDELEKNSTLYVTPSTTKLYRIQANRYTTPVYMSCNNTTANKNGEVQEGSGSNPDERRLGFSQSASAANLVQFESTDDGKFYIKDVNSGFYYGKKNEGSEGDGKLYLVKNNQWAGKYSIAYSLNGNVAQVGLKENQATDVTSQYLYCCGSDATAAVGDNSYVQFHSPYTDNAETGTAATVDAGCVYKIAEVSTYPLTISNALYASLCLPFSVTLPNGLKAYKVSSVTNGTERREMELTELTGAIAANEPVIIGATAAGTFNLTINADNAGTKSTDNWLTGATVKRTGIDEDYFALGYKALNSDDADTKTVGFFRVTTTNMPANKAYLLKSRIQESAANPAMMLTFNFGNVTTDIDSAKANEAESNNTYYDLNGRRVLYPTHGIYIKGNGQKVFIQ